jgi:flavin reductase (DIM6/NTAB) family NADH-FMN oxidoreductase RutF
MRNLPLSMVYRLIEPGPVVLLVTARSGRANLMTMSWHMMVEFEPPRIACVVSDGNFSFKALRATGECVIAIPSALLARKVVAIGNCHGDAVDKFSRFALTPVAAAKVRPPLVKECLANLECRVIDKSLVKKYGIFLLEVVKAWRDPRQTAAKMFHHRGYGEFAIDGRIVQLPSQMR